jgi:hypothetical protein
VGVRALAALATAALLTGCAAAGQHGAAVASPSGPVTSSGAARPARSVARTHDPDPRHQPVTLLPPGCSPGQLRLTPATPDGGGGEEYQVWSIHLVAGPPCTVWGTPRVRFLDARGAILPFLITDRWRHEHLGPVLVDAGHSPAFPVAKFRCDTTTNPSTVASVEATLPLDAGTLTGRVPPDAARLSFCPRDGGDQRIHVGTIGSWQTPTTGTAPRRPAISMHSRFNSGSFPTWGRADLDGDSRRDLVLVRPGLVTARLHGRVLRLRLPGNSTAELQGFADLTGDDRPDILVGGTSLGCGTGYRYCASRANAVTLEEGRLRVVRFPRGGPVWNAGEGDAFEGWVCRPGGPTEIYAEQTGVSSYRLSRTRYRVRGLHVSVVSRSVTRGTAGHDRLQALTRTRCPGLDRWGWAPERGPLG